MKFINAILGVLAVFSIATNMCSAELNVQVKKTNAGPQLYVNGKPTAPTIFFVNYDTPGEMRDLQFSEVESAGKHGVNIVSVPVPSCWLMDGEKPDFTALDNRIEQTIKHSPNVLILPRIGLSWTPSWWNKNNPNEKMLFDNGEYAIASVFSERWKIDTANQMKTIIEHLESKYGDHIIGYHPCALNTGEWFSRNLWQGRLGGYEKPALTAFRSYLKEKYDTVPALQKAWNNKTVTFDTAAVPSPAERSRLSSGSFRNPETEQSVIDYVAFENDAYADAADYMCKVIKGLASNKLAILFYGYHFELARVPHGLASSGHLGLRKLLNSPFVDAVCSPVSYFDRDAGGGGYFMSAVDSVQLNGKLWLVEDDTRTCLAPEVDENIPRLKTVQETYGVLQRNFAHVLTHGTALWWMDLYGNGRFQGDEIWQMLGKLAETYQASLPAFRQYKPEIAVIVDQRSEYYADPSPAMNASLLYNFRKQFYRIGAPVGLYLLDDLAAGKVPQAKMYIFLDTYRLDDSQIVSIRKYVCRKGCVNLWMYAPGVIDNNKLIPDRIEDITGIRLKRITPGESSIIYDTNAKFAVLNSPAAESQAVIDQSAKVIVKYAVSGETAVASKKMNGYTNIYSGAPQLPAELLRKFAELAGVHIYNDQNNVVMAGNGFVAISASSTGTKKLMMPSVCSLVDIITSKKYGPAKEYSFDMALGDTRIWKVLPIEK